jgi:hypothetical protein
MTPQSFSYGTTSNSGMIYMPPYGLNESIDYMLKLNPQTYEITKIPLNVDQSVEKWIWGIVNADKIYFLPYGESQILVVDTVTDTIKYIDLPFNNGHGKYVMGHLYNNKIFALPHGDLTTYDHVLIIDTTTDTAIQQTIDLDINDTKKWQLVWRCRQYKNDGSKSFKYTNKDFLL